MVASESLQIILSYLFKDVLYGFLLGLKDSCLGFKTVVFNGIRVCIYWATQSPKKKSKVTSKNYDPEWTVAIESLKCSTFNIIIFLLTFFVWSIISYFASFSTDLKLNEFSWVNLIITNVLRIFWTVPVCLIAKFTNCFWFQDIANSAYLNLHGNPPPISFSYLGNQISDLICSFVIEMMFLGQGSLMTYVPYPWISCVLYVVHAALSNSLYSFEYLWCNRGWSLNRRISYVESNWPYFLGFGTPLAIVSYYFNYSFFYNSMSYAMLCPFYIVGAFKAPPHTLKNRGPRLKLFVGVIWISSFFSKLMFRNAKKNKSK